MKKIFAVLASVFMLVPALAFAQTTVTTGHSMMHTKSHLSASSTLASLYKKGPAMSGHMMASSTITGLITKNSVNASSAKSTGLTGTVASVSGTSISLTAGSATYTVDASGAKIVRKYGAAMAVGDIQTGDSLEVIGTVSGTSVVAKTIRDNSQQQKDASFSGTVSSVNGSSFVLASKSRGNQTVNTGSATTFKENGQTSVSISNVTVGENVETSGVWDSTSNTVTASAVIIVVKTGTVSGVFQSASGEIISITSQTGSGTAYSVDATNAKLIRRYGAAMQLSDMQAGDILAVSGTINGSSITAKTIRDESLQAHNGSFTGTVSAVNGSGFTLQSKDRGSQTINTTATTVFRLGTASTTISSLAVGQTVTLSGVWDRTNSNVTASRVIIKVSSSSITGTVESVNGSTLTVMATGTSATTYTVDAGKAAITYKNGHKGAIPILQTNDQVIVRGQMVSGSTNITASLVRDLSQTYKAPTMTMNSTATPTTTNQ